LIEFFTVLVLTYYVQGDPWEVRVVYDTEDHCQEAMDDGVIDPLYEQLYDLYGNNIIIKCHTTELVSHEAIRPRLRPKNEG